MENPQIKYNVLETFIKGYKSYIKHALLANNYLFFDCDYNYKIPENRVKVLDKDILFRILNEKEIKYIDKDLIEESKKIYKDYSPNYYENLYNDLIIIYEQINKVTVGDAFQIYRNEVINSYGKNKLKQEEINKQIEETYEKIDDKYIFKEKAIAYNNLFELFFLIRTLKNREYVKEKFTVKEMYFHLIKKHKLTFNSDVYAEELLDLIKYNFPNLYTNLRFKAVRYNIYADLYDYLDKEILHLNGALGILNEQIISYRRLKSIYPGISNTKNNNNDSDKKKNINRINTNITSISKNNFNNLNNSVNITKEMMDLN